MEYRRLGHSGVRVSSLALGTWLTFGGKLDGNGATALVHHALDRGVNFFDTADVYTQGRGEEILGAALKGIPRKDYVLASKCYFPTGDGPNDRGLSRKHILETCHTALRRLDTDYLELFQCHRYDEHTPVEETVRAFDDLIRQGKILYWGVSCWSAAQIAEGVTTAMHLLAPPPISNQPCYNLLERQVEREVVPVCEQYGLGLLAYSPLAQGVLTGKYADGARPENSRATNPRWESMMGRFLAPESRGRVARFLKVARDSECSPAQLALAWVAAQPQVSSVVVGASSMAQLDENLGAVDKVIGPDLGAALDDIFPVD